MGTAIKARLRKLERAAPPDRPNVVVVAADRDEAEKRIAELRLNPETEVVLFLTGVRRSERFGNWQ